MESLKVKYEELEFAGYDGGGSAIYKHDGNYFTGIIVEYNEQGVLIGEIEYKNGYVDGVHREYYSNGQLEVEYYTKNNLLDGVFKDWDEAGNLISETHWKNGKEIN